MGREIIVQDTVVAAFVAAGWLHRKVIYAGRRGSPDAWLLRNGSWVCIEFKRYGEKPDGHQVREHQRLKDHGQRVYVIDNIEDGLALCKALS